MRRNDNGREPFLMGEVLVVRTTDKALLVEIDEDEVWIPKSVIHEDSDVRDNGDEGDLVVQLWWAEANGYA